MATVAGVQAVALQDAEAVSWDALPRDALVRVLGHLAGDVEALCASACVARAWRDAASEPTLWAQLQVLSEEVAARMTDENLLGLVVRARGGLEQLDISGAQNVTEEGLMAALQQPHALVVFQADRDCRGLSPQGVARALAAQNGRMRVLSVRGLDCGPEMESVELPEGVLEGMLAALRALLAPEGILDGDHLCDTCTRLCCETDDFCTTDDCPAVACDDCKEPEGYCPCFGCDKLFCDTCLVGAYCEECVRFDGEYEDDEGDEDEEDEHFEGEGRCIGCDKVCVGGE